MIKILVCEDDVHVAEMIKYVLKKNYDITIVQNGLDAIDLLETEGFHLIITDIVMPSLDGYELLRYLEDVDDHTPVVILSSLNSETNQIDGYKYDIEDYIVKPFHAGLFEKKIDKIINRIYSFDSSDTVVNENNLSVKIKGFEIEFTPIEFKVFYHLFINNGKYCSKYDILMLFWGEANNERVVDYTIKRIRKKMGEYSDYIVTKAKVGYMYKDEN